LAAANPNAYFANSRLESTLRLGFAPGIGDTANVRAVRWTGPGLPAAGVVTVRSSRCATDDRLAITNQEGSLLVNNGTIRQFWTSGATTEFVLSAARLDGSPLTMPVPSASWATTTSPSSQEFSPSPVDIPIPAWSQYRAEVFNFDNTSSPPVPDAVYLVRTSTAYDPAPSIAARPWPTLSSSSIDQYLRPTGAGAGRITDVSQTLSWTEPSAGSVVLAGIFSQNLAQATNGESETALYWNRGYIRMFPQALGSGTATGSEWLNPQSGTSLSASTASIGSNPNPRCGAPQLEPLETGGSSFSYREVNLFYRGADRKLYNDTTFWSQN
jgi:hypothetical protein